jgi:hypothetical protein
VNWAAVAVGIVILAAFCAWDLICYAWVDERVRQLTERVKALEPIDDSPGHEAEMYDDDDAPTEEFPALPATEPTGIPLAVQSALLRPSPVPRELMTPDVAEKQRTERAEWVEEQMSRFQFTGRDR